MPDERNSRKESTVSLNVVIEKGIERPKVRRRVGSNEQKYPFFERMEVGDSIYFKADEIRPVTILNAANRHRKRNPTWQYSSRSDANGVRIWREPDKGSEQEAAEAAGQ